MGRTKNETTSAAVVLTDADTPSLPMAAAASDKLASLSDVYGEERDLINQLLGQAQMAGAFEDFSRTVRTSKLAFVKENKLYRSLAGRKTPHGAEILSGTWEEFCALTGRSVDQVDRDIANLKTFGEEALESMSRMGIGYRELRQFRKLPEDSKQALIEVAKVGDKEGFVELAEELIAKHSKEKEQLSTQLETRSEELEASRKHLEKTQKELISLKVEKKKLAELDPDADDPIKQARATLSDHGTAAEVFLRGSLNKVIADLLETDQTQLTESRAFVAGILAQLELAIHGLRNTYEIDSIEEIDGRPVWMDTPIDGEGV